MSAKHMFIGTSWKMNKTRVEAEAFADMLLRSAIAQSKEFQPFIIPPYPYIATVAERLKSTRVMIGAQNMHWADKGAWTGEISPLMIKDCGATLVELGHSERRTHFGETDETVAIKTAAALAHGLIPLVCIGDTKQEYEAGITSSVLETQVKAALSKTDRESARKVLFAYEPVWSIGEGGVPADPAFANDEHQKIKSVTKSLVGMALPILYGGSVNPENCVDLGSRPAIDGLFIGRSAWDAPGYIDICQKVTKALAI
jgi:triosephosphate isomerase